MARSGGFGCFLNLDIHWADWVETKRSYELILIDELRKKVRRITLNRPKCSEYKSVSYLAQRTAQRSRPLKWRSAGLLPRCICEGYCARFARDPRGTGLIDCVRGRCVVRRASDAMLRPTGPRVLASEGTRCLLH